MNVTTAWRGVVGQAESPEEVRTVVEEILSRSEYQPPGESVLGRVLRHFFGSLGRWIEERLGRLLERLFTWDVPFQSADVAGLNVVVLLAVIVAVVLVVGYVLWRARRGGTVGVIEEGTVGRAPSLWLTEAERHEAAGEYREALRCRYRHSVATLATKGLLQERQGRTTGQLLADVASSRPVVAPSFQALTEIFEQVWYGGSKATPGTVAQAQELHRRCVAALSGRGDGQ